MILALILLGCGPGADSGGPAPIDWSFALEIAVTEYRASSGGSAAAWATVSNLVSEAPPHPDHIGHPPGLVVAVVLVEAGLVAAHQQKIPLAVAQVQGGLGAPFGVVQPRYVQGQAEQELCEVAGGPRGSGVDEQDVSTVIHAHQGVTPDLV